MADNAKWYVIHTYSGYENAVKAAIEKSVVNRNMSDMVLKMEIPMETVTEVTESGVMKEVERKVFPGYVLIKMILTDDTWHLIRNIRGVTGFVGEANKAIPLTEEEVAALGVEKHEVVVLYNVGDTVKITDGPLASFMGTVEEIDADKNKVRVVVSMFGRETPVELSSIRSRSSSPECVGRTQAGASPPAQVGETLCVSPRAGPVFDRLLPHFYEGGASLWHRKSLVM